MQFRNKRPRYNSWIPLPRETKIFKVQSSQMAWTMATLKSERLLQEIEVGDVITSHEEYNDNLDVVFLNCLVLFFCASCWQLHLAKKKK